MEAYALKGLPADYADATVHGSMHEEPSLLFVGTDLAPLDPGYGALEAVVSRWAAAVARIGRVSLLSFGPVAHELRCQVSGEVYEVASVHEARSVLSSVRGHVTLLSNRPLWGTWVDGPVLHVLHNFPDAWGASSEGELALAKKVLREQPSAAVSSVLAREVERVAGLAPGACNLLRPSIDPAFSNVSHDPDGHVVLFPHRLMRKKGLELALEAFCDPRLSGLELWVTDNLNPWRALTGEHLELRRAVRSCRRACLVPPRSPGDEMASLYAMARAVLCPSTTPEGLGLVALEAQAVGCPVVTSGLGGLSEVTFPPNECLAELTASSLAEATLRAVERSSDPSCKIELPVEFTPEGSAGMLMDLLVRVASEPRRSEP